MHAGKNRVVEQANVQGHDERVEQRVDVFVAKGDELGVSNPGTGQQSHAGGGSAECGQHDSLALSRRSE